MEIRTSFQRNGGSTAVISNRQSRSVAYVAPREAWLLAERRPVAFRQSAKPAVAAAVLIEDKGSSGPALSGSGILRIQLVH
jgi:hypothetical protein